MGTGAGTHHAGCGQLIDSVDSINSINSIDSIDSIDSINSSSCMTDSVTP